MTRVREGRTLLVVVALFASFCAGFLVDEWLRTYDAPKALDVAAKLSQTPEAPTVAAAPSPATQLTGPPDQPTMAAVQPNPAAQLAGPLDEPTISAPPAPTLEAGPAARLRMPIDGTSIESFKGGFAETRGNRSHEAVDIVVARGTPIHAVQNGTIAKLFFSQFGGITIYQFDPDERLCFYYAHLDRYADGLHDGQRVSQGEVIGYVGASGNAAPGTPHLHFAIFELNADRKWWQGRALDPYLVFKEKG